VFSFRRPAGAVLSGVVAPKSQLVAGDAGTENVEAAVAIDVAASTKWAPLNIVSIVVSTQVEPSPELFFHQLTAFAMVGARVVQ
jgi:hypothetical protein